jgi:hypothetical protein
MILACVVVLVGVFFVSTGRGGELSRERPDYAPLDLGPVSATDVALLRPPTALWGYNMSVTDEALERIARAVRERDITIAYLQEQLADLTGQAGPVPEVPRAHAHPGDGDPAGPVAQDYRAQQHPAGPAAAAAAEETEETGW